MSRLTKLCLVQFGVFLAGALVSSIASAAGEPAKDSEAERNEGVIATSTSLDGPKAADAPNPGRVWTLEELLNLARKRSVNAFKASYATSQYQDGALPLAKLNGMAVLNFETHVIADLKTPRYAFEVRGVKPALARKGDPDKRGEKTYWDPKSYVVYQVASGTATIDDNSSSDSKSRLIDPLLFSMLLHPAESAAEFDGSLISLLRFGVVHKGTEEFDGRRCCVVDIIRSDGTMSARAWLDLDRSLALLRFWKFADDGKAVRTEWHSMDLIELSSAGQRLWMPMRVDTVTRLKDAAIKARITVDKGSAELNPVLSDTMFRPEFPPGTQVQNRVGGQTHVTTVGAPKAAKSLTPPPLVKVEELSASLKDGQLGKIERKITKEPNYTGSPRYALLILGADARAKVWMVEDGNHLYIDKNGNGDLTDDGPPITQSNLRRFQVEKGLHRDCKYVLDEFQPAGGPRVTDFCLRRWNDADKEDSYGLSLTLDGKVPMYAGWFGTFWASSPDAVPLVHFGGAVRPVTLGCREIVLDSTPDRLGIGFVNRTAGDGTTTYLSIDALPKSVVPEVRIDWPVADGAKALRTSERLTERCCYWQFYEEGFKVPKGVVEGTAVLTVSVPKDIFPLVLESNEFRLPIRASKQKPSDQ
jgi:hypothetical protein